jgi:AhpD family alkylhydroperoxidase
MEKLSSAERGLVALGAALGGNCVPCFEYHIPEARKAGSAIRRSVTRYALPTRFGRFLPGRFSPRPLACSQKPVSGPMPSRAGSTAPKPYQMADPPHGRARSATMAGQLRAIVRDHCDESATDNLAEACEFGGKDVRSLQCDA